MPTYQTPNPQHHTDQLFHYIQRFQGNKPEPLETINTAYVKQVLTYINRLLLNRPTGDIDTETYSHLCDIFIFIASKKPQHHENLLFLNDLPTRELISNSHPVKASHLLLLWLKYRNEKVHNPKALIKTLAENYRPNQTLDCRSMTRVLFNLNTIIEDKLISGLSQDDLSPLITRALRLANIEPRNETWASLGQQLSELCSSEPKENSQSLLAFIDPQAFKPDTRQREHERPAPPPSPLMHVAYPQNGLLGKKRLNSCCLGGVDLNLDDIPSDSNDNSDLKRAPHSPSLEPGEIRNSQTTKKVKELSSTRSPR